MAGSRKLDLDQHQHQHQHQHQQTTGKDTEDEEVGAHDNGNHSTITLFPCLSLGLAPRRPIHVVCLRDRAQIRIHHLPRRRLDLQPVYDYRGDLAVAVLGIVEDLYLQSGFVDMRHLGRLSRKIEDAAIAAALDLPVEGQVERA